jgi:hypothetical protein
MSLPKLLKYLLKESLDEVAKSIGDAQAAGFAIFRDNENIIIFEPKAFFDMMESMNGENALTNNVNELKQEMEKYTSLFPQYLPKYKAGSWENELNLFLSYLDKFQKTNDPKAAISANNIVGNIQNQYWQLYSARAKTLRGKTKERYELNKEKQSFDKLLNRVRDTIELKANPNVSKRILLINRALIDCIRGYIKYNLSNDCTSGPETYQVDKSAAKKGWGPLTYDITMSVIHPAYLIADRGSNSSDADKVWTYYLNNRPDVHKEFMEEIITGDCDLPTSPNEAVKSKLKRAQRLIDQSKDEVKPSYEDEDQEPPELDHERLADVIEEMKKILANVPQAWRFQIATPINISTMDNNYKLFIDKVKSVYGQPLSFYDFQDAGNMFFDVNYSPGD